MNKFGNVPVDPDTIIKKEEIIDVGHLQALYQRWVWEGIIAESLIFLNEDVGGMSDDDLVSLGRDAGILKRGGKSTISRSDTYTFLNMNFENPI